MSYGPDRYKRRYKSKSYISRTRFQGKSPHSSTRKKQTSTRGGIMDLLLAAIVVGACWVRTPVGGLVERGLAMVTDFEREIPSLTSYFITELPPEIIAIAEVMAETGLNSMVVPLDGFPEPWRSVVTQKVTTLTTVGQLQYDAILSPNEGEPVLALLDDVYRGDPEAALELLVMDVEMRDRAIRRSRSAGDAHPERFSAHRRYLPAEIARQADDVVGGTMALGTILRLTWPVAGPHRISSSYGFRHHPILSKRKFHNGVDLAVPTGTPILAAQAGTASAVAEDNLNGRYIVIDHGYGVRSSYCHLSEHHIAKGDKLKAGDLIGDSGSTGRSTGPHLHFTLRVGGDTVDPEKFRFDDSGADA